MADVVLSPGDPAVSKEMPCPYRADESGFTSESPESDNGLAMGLQ